MQLFLGMLLGVLLTVSAAAAWRLWRAPRQMLSPEAEAMQAALHAATATLPHLRRGLTAQTAAKAAPHLRALTQATGVALADEEVVLAVDGDAPPLRRGEALPAALGASAEGLHVHVAGGSAAVVAPVVALGRRAGTLVACFEDADRVGPDDTRVVEEVALLVAAQVELSGVQASEDRAARAELRALRAQISPHFIYNALAAVASLIHTRPDEARELLAEFAEFTRYLFRGERPYVTLADELRHAERYLRLEQARFGERLQVRVEIAPEVLAAVVPVLSVQPLVENAVRHGVESRAAGGTVEVLGHDLGGDVEIVVRDDGPGIDPARVAGLLDGTGAGGIGLSNVHARLRQTFGPRHGLAVAARAGGGTEVVMTVPKFQAGIRAA